jgi:D-threo-aldose 1-dehydrogenase
VALASAALQFAGAHPLVVSVIPGAQSIAELRANLAGSAVSIPPALWDDLRAAGLLHPQAPTPEMAATAC